MKRRSCLWGAVLCTLLSTACERLDDDPDQHVSGAEALFTLDDVARLLSGVPVGSAQMVEVHDAVEASSGNGYDEEYTLQDLFTTPGAGVGSGGETRAGGYDHPLRDLLRTAVQAKAATKAEDGGIDDPEAYLDALAASDVQIYWPYSERWDGMTRPVITFDPGDNSERNVGYTLDGEELVVDEALAMERPVWVVNRNADAEFMSLELRRREDPSWGQGGGEILVKSAGEESGIKTLVLRSFMARRNYDPWFAGASEFFVKVGAVEDFTASTEAELRLYSPSITDFMIVVRRSQVGQTLPFNAVLVSEWTPQLLDCAFMMIEDDGGTRTSWKCSAMVKYNSKSYGFEIELPLYTRDDIVWRGSLSRSYIEKYAGTVGHFGDVDLVLDLI